MTKWCLCVTEEREISTPKFFDTYEEAYQEMKKLLLNGIADSCFPEKYLSDDGEINYEDGENNGAFFISPEKPFSDHDTMWCNLDDDYSLDAAVFRIDIK